MCFVKYLVGEKKIIEAVKNIESQGVKETQSIQL